MKSFLERPNHYRKGKIRVTEDIIIKADNLFNFEYLIYPRSNVSREPLSIFSEEQFTKYISDFPFPVINNIDKDTLLFEHKELCSWFERKISESREEG